MKDILSNGLAKYYLPSGVTNMTAHNFDGGMNSTHILHATQQSNTLIANFFEPINGGVVSSKPIIDVTSSKVTISVFYYMSDSNTAINANTINALGEILSNVWNLPVELRFVKLHYPYLNADILAAVIMKNLESDRFERVISKIFGNVGLTQENNLPSNIIGIKVQLSGRLTTEPSQPRMTVQSSQIGSFKKSTQTIIEYGQCTSSNKKGALTVQVWISQRSNSH